MKKYMIIAFVLVLLIGSACKTAPEPVTVSEATPELTSEPTPKPTPKPTPEPTLELTPEPTPAPVSAEAKLTTGGFEGNVYHNPYFGMTFTVPEEWSIATEDEIAAIFSLGKDILNDLKEDNADKLANTATLPLTYVSKHPLDAECLNSNLNIVITNMGLSSLFIQKPSDMIEPTLKQFKDINLPYELKKSDSVDINGQSFAMIEGVLTLQGIECYQRTYFTICNHYLITFTCTYFDDEDLKAMDQIIQSITFKD